VFHKEDFSSKKLP